jgi:tetratricopeptide (TPR) repeat protein
MSTLSPYCPSRFALLSGACWALVFGVVFSVLSVDADAMSLGRSRGAALLGRPLDVSVQLTLDPNDPPPSASCFSADVFYGDSQVGAQSLSISPKRSAANEMTLHVRSSAPINEAFVTVYVKASCGLQTVSRKYVLLSDSPSEPALSNADAALQATPSSSIRVPAKASDAGANSETALAFKPSVREARRVAREARQREAALAAANAPVPVPSVVKKRDKSFVASTSSPRLQLDLLDLSPGKDLGLRASTELLTVPTTDPKAREQAAAMWRAINASPEDILRDGARLQTIESDVRKMAALTQQQTQELGVLKTDLAKAQQQRYANPFVYALGAISLASLAFAAWAWHRSRRRVGEPWWGNVQRYSDSSGYSTRSGAARPSKMNTQEGGSSIGTTKKAAVLPERSSGFGVFSPMVTQPVMPLHETANTAASNAFGAQSDFAAGAAAGSRTVNAEELFDIQQQADFFMSLGQYTQAIDILQNHISDNVETSAVAYLDLFDIYHKIDQRAEFADLRESFNRVFNAQVPEFDLYGGHSSRGLEDYPNAIERIQELWPNEKVLEVIEQSIFRKPDRDNQPFDLLAYRELMLLYAVAKEVSERTSLSGDLTVDFEISPEPSASLPAAGLMTELQPLSATLAAPLDTEQDNLDIDLELFAPVKPAVPVPAKKPVDDNNLIDFDMATERGFRPSQGAKLSKY